MHRIVLKIYEKKKNMPLNCRVSRELFKYCHTASVFKHKH